MSTVSRVQILVATMLLAGCGGTDPSDPPTHPAGAIVGTTALVGGPFGVAISRDGLVLITRHQNGTVSTAQLPDTTFGPAIAVGQIPNSVTFNPSGTRAFVTNQGSGTIGIINLASNAQLDSIDVGATVYSLAYCRSNKRLYITGPTLNVYVVDPLARILVDSVAVPAVTNGITVNSDCSRVYVGVEGTAEVVEINPATNTVTRHFPAPGAAVKDVAVGADRLYAADENAGGVRVWNLTSGAAVTTVSAAPGAFGLALSPDGAHLYAGITQQGRVLVISTASNTVVDSILTGGIPRRIAFNASGTQAVIANENGWVSFVQ